MATKDKKNGDANKSDIKDVRWLNVSLEDADMAVIAEQVADGSHDAVLFLLECCSGGVDFSVKRSKDGSVCAMCFFSLDCGAGDESVAVSAFANGHVPAIVALSTKLGKVFEHPTTYAMSGPSNAFGIR